MSRRLWVVVVAVQLHCVLPSVITAPQGPAQQALWSGAFEQHLQAQPLAFLGATAARRVCGACPMREVAACARSSVLAPMVPRRAKAALAARTATAEAPELLFTQMETVDGVDVLVKLESLGGSRRRISGALSIPAPVGAVWDVLTNYDALQDYIPNIAASKAIRQPNGRLHLEQVGVISKRLRLTTSVVLSVEEKYLKTITFSKVSSPGFVEFEGTYTFTQFTPTESSDGTTGASTYLEYSIVALPLPVVPVFLVQGKILDSVPAMLSAVRKSAISKYAEDQALLVP